MTQEAFDADQLRKLLRAVRDYGAPDRVRIHDTRQPGTVARPRYRLEVADAEPES